MNPDDNGETMDPVDMANELYIGAMQDVCDAVEHMLNAEVSEIELAPAEEARQALHDAMLVYETRRDEMHATNRAEAARLGL